VRIAVLGAGVGGLASAIALGRQGHHVTLIEQDGGPQTEDPVEAFTTWARKGVRQARQGHEIFARGLNVLREHAPDVLENLEELGGELSQSPLVALFPPECRLPGDEELALLSCRRITFELALRRAAAETPGVDIQGGVKATGLVIDAGSVPRIRGMTTSVGRIDSNLIVDAGGRRSPVRSWLQNAGVSLPEERAQDCGVTQYTRYYRIASGSFDPWALTTLDEADYCLYSAFPGDRGTFAIALEMQTRDTAFRILRFNNVWEAAVMAFPKLAPWIAPSRARPLSAVDPMGGFRNSYRPFVDGTRLPYLGCIPVGDSLCTTDPMVGWGLSLAIHHAFTMARVVEADLDTSARRYAHEVQTETEACFRATAAGSRVRLAHWRGESPDVDDPDVRRQILIREGVIPAMFEDPILLRAAMRMLHLIDRPDAIFDNADVLERARNVQRRRPGASAAGGAPAREELLAITRAALPPQSRPSLQIENPK